MDKVICWFFAISDFLESHDGAITAIATVFIAIFTIALAYSTKRLWREAKSASRIAKQSADAAEKSAKVSEIALIVTQRAYISGSTFEAIPIRDEQSNIKEWQISIYWQNDGLTPANPLHIGTNLLIGEIPLRQFGAGERKTPISLGRGNKTRGIASPNLTYEQAKQIVGNDLQVFLLGFVEYNDAFGDIPLRHTSVCMQIRVDDPTLKEQPFFRFEAYEKYNYAD